MAGEITANTAQFSASKGGASTSTGSLTKTLDMAGVDMGSNTQAVGTAAEVLNCPADIGFPAHVIIKNLDSTNFVTVYSDSGGAHQCSKLVPGDWCKLPAISAVPYVKADTAACQIQWWACEV